MRLNIFYVLLHVFIYILFLISFYFPTTTESPTVPPRPTIAAGSSSVPSAEAAARACSLTMAPSGPTTAGRCHSGRPWVGNATGRRPGFPEPQRSEIAKITISNILIFSNISKITQLHQKSYFETSQN